MSDLWTIGRKDMRTWSPFDEDVELFAHFIYEPDPPGFDKDDPSTWGRRWRIIGPADGSEDDPQNVAQSLADAINARLKAASGWRPIEEAPKSQPGSRYGPDILGWSPDDGYGVWHWHATNRRPYWARWRTTTTPDRNHQPTHWMHLPPAPSKE